MSFILYVLVLIASVSSVLLGLDWLASPPQTWRPVQVASQQQSAKNSATTKPVKAAETKSATTSKSATTKKKSEARVAAAQDATIATSSEANITAGNSKPDAIATADVQDAAGPATTGSNPGPSDSPGMTGASRDSGTSPSTAAASAVPACNVRACESAYRSFRASDCTYQPYGSPRRFCDKGAAPAAPTAQTTLGGMRSARAQASFCNVQACAASYQSFNPVDCTYQPYDGPRQLCTK